MSELSHRRAPHLHRLTLAIVLAAAVAACTNESDREAGDVCEQVGFAIASRTLACSGDTTLANSRFEDFQASTQCTSDSVADLYFSCVRAVNTKSCAEVTQLADDFDRWIDTSSTCPPLFGRGPGGAS